MRSAARSATATTVVTDSTILAVLHRALLETLDDPMAHGEARAPELVAEHIAQVLDRAATCPIGAFEPGRRASTTALRISLILLRLKREGLVRHERTTEGRAFIDRWAITLDGVAKARRDAQ